MYIRCRFLEKSWVQTYLKYGIIGLKVVFRLTIFFWKPSQCIQCGANRYPHLLTSRVWIYVQRSMPVHVPEPTSRWWSSRETGNRHQLLSCGGEISPQCEIIKHTDQAKVCICVFFSGWGRGIFNAFNIKFISFPLSFFVNMSLQLLSNIKFLIQGHSVEIIMRCLDRSSNPGQQCPHP